MDSSSSRLCLSMAVATDSLRLLTTSQGLKMRCLKPDPAKIKCIISPRPLQLLDPRSGSVITSLPRIARLGPSRPKLALSSRWSHRVSATKWNQGIKGAILELLHILTKLKRATLARTWRPKRYSGSRASPQTAHPQSRSQSGIARVNLTTKMLHQFPHPWSRTALYHRYLQLTEKTDQPWSLPTRTNWASSTCRSTQVKILWPSREGYLSKRSILTVWQIKTARLTSRSQVSTKLRLNQPDLLQIKQFEQRFQSLRASLVVS